MQNRVRAAVMVMMLVLASGRAFAQSGPGTCVLPPGINPYVDPIPANCRNQSWMPYQVAAGEFKPTAFLFTGGVLNAETLPYVDLMNGSTYAQRVDVELQVATGDPMQPIRRITRSFVLPPEAPASWDVHADPELAGQAFSFSLKVTFERIGVATLTMRPADAPWSSAITPTPRIIDLTPATSTH